MLHVLSDGRTIGALALADEVRPAAREAIQALHDLGIETAMLTGDAQNVAEAVGRELGFPVERVPNLQVNGVAVVVFG